MRVLVLPDIHLPYQDKRALRAVKRYAEERAPWDEIVQLGDLLDFASMPPGGRAQKHLRQIPKSCIQREINPAYKFFDEWRPLAKKFVFLEGNHDTRLHCWVAANIDFLEPEEWTMEAALRLPDYNVTYYPFWSTNALYTVGKATFLHGDSVAKNHGDVNGRLYDGNLFYGHVHSVDAETVTRKNRRFSRVIQSLGCLNVYQPEYTRGRPNKWQQAFGEFTFFPNGHFSYTVPLIVNGQFAIDGQVYKGK